MKTREQFEAQVTSYLNKTEMHLFQTESKRALFKVIPFSVGEDKYVAEITYGEKSSVYFRKISPLNDDRFYIKRNLKDSFFMYSEKKLSIPNFKSMRKATAEIKEVLESLKELNLTYGKNQELEKAILAIIERNIKKEETVK